MHFHILFTGNTRFEHNSPVLLQHRQGHKEMYSPPSKRFKTCRVYCLSFSPLKRALQNMYRNKPILILKGSFPYHCNYILLRQISASHAAPTTRQTFHSLIPIIVRRIISVIIVVTFFHIIFVMLVCIIIRIRVTVPAVTAAPAAPTRAGPGPSPVPAS